MLNVSQGLTLSTASLVSHLLTECQHPPGGLQGLVHHVVRLHADRLQLRLSLRLCHFVLRYLKQMSPITGNPSRFSVWEARCVLSNHLSLCLLWPPPSLSTSLYSLLSHWSVLITWPGYWPPIGPALSFHYSETPGDRRELERGCGSWS